MLKIARAKPNPEGEDKYSKPISKYQLAGEWFDIYNDSLKTESLTGIEIFSFARNDGNEEKWMSIYKFSEGDSIGGWKTLRVHSGPEVEIERLANIDKLGADEHVFTSLGYILRNDKKDRLAIWDSNKNKFLDQVYYDEYPQEGAILERNEKGKLVYVERENPFY